MLVEMQSSAESSFQKLIVGNSYQKTHKIRCYIFEVFSNFTVFHYFVPIALSRVVAVYEIKTATIGAIFRVNNAELYVPFVKLPINDNIKFLENITP